MSNARFGLRVRNGLIRGITEGQQAIFLDPDAAAFLTAAGITDSTITSAIDTLVISLKNANLWTKMKALYPFVGGTASTHKWNLKDPRDLNAAFRLVFFGGWTHDNLGATPNGSNAYANTFFYPSIHHISINNASFGFYSGTNTPSNGASMGAQSSPFGFNNIYVSYLGNFEGYINDGGTTTIVNSNTGGFFGLSRVTSNQRLISIRNTIYNQSSSATFAANQNMLLATTTQLNSDLPSGNYSPWTHRLTWLGDGLTQTDLGNLFTIVTTFQTTLGRQI